MLPRFSLAVIFGVLLNTTAFAASHSPQQCGNLDPESDGDADRAFQCITDLELKIEALAALVASQTGLINALTTDMKNTIPAVADDANTRSVIAFTADKGEKTCPKSWKPFEPAKDRFIVGAGGKYPVFSIANPLDDSTGGSPEVTLTEAQMPMHRHKILAAGNSTDASPTSSTSILRTATKAQGLPNDNIAYVLRGSSDEPKLGRTSQAGSSEPHPNIPPYIALVYCQKV